MTGFLIRNKNKIFFRVLLLNFIVLSSLVVIYQIASYLYFNKSYNQKVTDAFTYNVAQTKYLLDNALLKTQFELLNTYFNTAVQPNVSFNKFLNTEPLESDEILEISRVMPKLLYLYPRIQRIRIYTPSNNLMFINGHVAYLEAVALHEQQNKELDVFKQFYEDGKRQTWLYNEQTRTLSFLLALPYYSFNDEISSVICFDSSIDSFLEIMDSSMSFALFSDSGTPLYQPDDMAKQDYSGIIAQMNTAGEAQRILNRKVDGKPVVEVLVKSEHTGLYYLFGMQGDSMTSNFLFSILALFLMNTTLLAVFFVISYLLTKQVHKPLERIITAARNTVRTPGPVGDDYNLLDQTVENVHALRSKIDSNSGIIYETMVRSLLDGTFNGTRFADNYRTSKISFGYDYVFAVIIKLFDNTPAQAIALVEQLRHSEQEYQLYPIYHAGENELHAVANAIDNNADEVAQQLRAALCCVQGLSFNIFTGNVYDLHEQNIYLSMCEARSIAEYSYIMESTTVLCYSVFTNINLDSAADHSGRLALVEHALQNQNVEAAKQKCLDYLESLKSFEYDITYIKKSVLDIILCIKTVLSQTAAVQCDEVVELGARSLQNNINVLEAQLSQVVFPAIERHLEIIKDDISLESQLMRVINEAPYESITLDYVASRLNMRNCAFSKAFKAMTNINFIDYVKNMKLEYAVKLLEEGKLPVKDISAKLGYNTPHYFIKIFKERYSCTPKQYQNMRMAENLREQNDRNALPPPPSTTSPMN